MRPCPGVGPIFGARRAIYTHLAGKRPGEAFQPLAAGEIALLENMRFDPGEETDEAALADDLAALGDLYVNDAFSAAHRAHASTHGLAHRLPACAGALMVQELEALEAALGRPKRPVMAVVGGAKVSTKFDLLENLSAKVDQLVIGGGMANTLLFAQGKGVGTSLCEPDLARSPRCVYQGSGPGLHDHVAQ